VDGSPSFRPDGHPSLYRPASSSYYPPPPPAPSPAADDVPSHGGLAARLMAARCPARCTSVDGAGHGLSARTGPGGRRLEPPRLPLELFLADPSCSPMSPSLSRLVPVAPAEWNERRSSRTKPLPGPERLQPFSAASADAVFRTLPKAPPLTPPRSIFRRKSHPAHPSEPPRAGLCPLQPGSPHPPLPLGNTSPPRARLIFRRRYRPWSRAMNAVAQARAKRKDLEVLAPSAA